MFEYLEDDPYFRGVEIVGPTRRKIGRQVRDRSQKEREESEQADSLSSEG